MVLTRKEKSDKLRNVRLYYNRLAKEKNKDSEWASKQVEKIIDRDELETEFEHAKFEISQDLDEMTNLGYLEKQKYSSYKVIKHLWEKN